MRQNPAHLVPLGQVVTRPWLKAQGVGRHTLDNWIKSKQLVSVARGVFERPGTPLTWRGLTISLQRMGSDLKPGGITALDLHGITHYVSQQPYSQIYVYGRDPLPHWVNEVSVGAKFIRCRALDLAHRPSSEQSPFWVQWSSQSMLFTAADYSMEIASQELALFELLLGVPRDITVEHAAQLMESMPHLSPKRLDLLLESCQNIKVKRLFLWLAERTDAPWLKHIDLKRFSMESGALGSGKRMIVKGGKLDPKYLITLPREMLERPFG